MIPVLAAVGVAVLILDGILVFFALKHGSRARLVKETPLAQVGQLAPGPAKVVGRAVAITEVLDGPLSGNPCVYYSFQAQEKRTRGGPPFPPTGGGSHWKTVIDDTQTAPCGVDDGTGVAAVALPQAEFVLASVQDASSGFWTGASPELEGMLNQRYQHTAKGLIFNKSMRFSETLITVGQDLVVVGTAQPTAGRNWIIAQQGGPLIVSDLGDARLVSHYRRFANLLWLLAVFVIVLAAVGVAIALPAR